jgi:hypothetical protein
MQISWHCIATVMQRAVYLCVKCTEKKVFCGVGGLDSIREFLSRLTTPHELTISDISKGQFSKILIAFLTYLDRREY